MRNYDKPFLMTWLNILTFQIYFIFLFTGDPLTIWMKRQQEEEIVEMSERSTGGTEETCLEGKKSQDYDFPNLNEEDCQIVDQLPPFTTWQVSKVM